MDVAGIAVDLPEGPAEPPGESAGIQLGRDDDPPAGDVQPPANRNSADTSARRQHSLGRPSPLNSSFTVAVITTLAASLHSPAAPVPSAHTDNADEPDRRCRYHGGPWTAHRGWGPQVAGWRSLSR